MNWPNHELDNSPYPICPICMPNMTEITNWMIWLVQLVRFVCRIWPNIMNIQIYICLIQANWANIDSCICYICLFHLIRLWFIKYESLTKKRIGQITNQIELALWFAQFLRPIYHEYLRIRWIERIKMPDSPIIKTK